MSTITINSFTIPHYAINEATVKLRIYPTSSFVTSDGHLVAGNPSSSLNVFYKEITCSVSGQTITVPSFTIDSTSDSDSPFTAAYNAAIFDVGGTILRTWLFKHWKVPAGLGSSITFAQLKAYQLVAMPEASINTSVFELIRNAEIRSNQLKVLDVPFAVNFETNPVDSTLSLPIESTTGYALEAFLRISSVDDGGFKVRIGGTAPITDSYNINIFSVDNQNQIQAQYGVPRVGITNNQPGQISPTFYLMTIKGSLITDHGGVVTIQLGQKNPGAETALQAGSWLSLKKQQVYSTS